MKVSAVIPTYNEKKDIRECIMSLKNQSFKNLEIIIVDDGSTDKTIEIAKKEKVEVLNQNHSGPGLARNFGVKKAKGKIILFVDADMTFDKNYVEKLIEPIIKDKTGKIIGTTHELEIVKNIKNIWSRCWGKIRVNKEESKGVKIFRAIRKDKFLELGGIDPKYGYADDQTFWFKYKIKPIVAENTLCYHKNPENLKAVYKQSRWIGASINYKILENLVLRYFAPFIGMLFSPIGILLLSIKRCVRNDDFEIFPQMIVFMTVRYFGTLVGIYRKIYLKKNFR